MNPNTWRPEDGHLLQKLRIQAGIDSHVFARNNTLSFAQLQELESGIGNCFYSDLIKRSVGIKLLKKMGYDMPAPIAQEEQNTVERWTTSSTQEREQAQQQAPLQTGPAKITAEATRHLGPQTRSINPMIWMGGLLIVGLLGLLGFQGQAPAPAAAPAAVLTPSHYSPSDTTRSANPATETASPPQATEPAPDRTQLASVSCEDQHRNNSPSHTPSNPLKPGNYIFIEARADSELCVLDSDNKLHVLILKAGMTQKVNGLAPFLLHTSNWQGVQVFFQGRPVQTDHGDRAHLVLNSLPL